MYFVREVQVGYIPKLLDRLSVVGAGRFFLGVERPNMATDNGRNILFALLVRPFHSLVLAGRAIGLGWSIDSVHPVWKFSKIRSSAVKRISVDVIDFKFREPHDLAMQVDGLSVFSPHRVIGSVTGITRCPQILTNLFRVLRVNQGNVALGQRDGERAIAVVDQRAWLVAARTTLLQAFALGSVAFRTDGGIEDFGGDRINGHDASFSGVVSRSRMFQHRGSESLMEVYPGTAVL